MCYRCWGAADGRDRHQPCAVDSGGTEAAGAGPQDLPRQREGPLGQDLRLCACSQQEGLHEEIQGMEHDWAVGRWSGVEGWLRLKMCKFILKRRIMFGNAIIRK